MAVAVSQAVVRASSILHFDPPVRNRVTGNDIERIAAMATNRLRW